MEKKTVSCISLKMGSVFVVVVGLCLMAVAIAITIKLIMWMF